jgi:carotenoid cleavage dioxygenase
MDVVFPDIPAYAGWGAPMRSESTLQDLELISGSVPRDIGGTLYRCGPDRQYPPMSGEDIFIDGEGMAHMWRFEDGHVDYRSRWMRNERFLLQEEARRSLFGRYRNRHTNDPSVAGKAMGTANTNAIFHGGRLLVLKEDSLPFEADPDTLESIGEWDFHGEVTSKTLSAHPKIDLVTNEMLTYGHQAKGDGTTDMVYYVIGADGHVADVVWFHAPYAGVVHDFGVTESLVIFPFVPLITDVDVL